MSEDRNDGKKRSSYSWTNLDDQNNDPMKFYYPVFPVFKGPDKNSGGNEGCTDSGADVGGDSAGGCARDSSDSAVSSDSTTTGCVTADSSTTTTGCMTTDSSTPTSGCVTTGPTTTTTDSVKSCW